MVALFALGMCRERHGKSERMGIEETGTVNAAKPLAHANDAAPARLVRQFNEAVNQSAMAETTDNAQSANNTRSAKGQLNPQQNAGTPVFGTGSENNSAQTTKDTARSIRPIP